jgi:hypothetical protein
MITPARKILCAMALSVGMTGFAQAQGFNPLPQGIERASTAPSKRLELNFNNIGIVDKVLVKDGQVIKEGDVLMVQDTEIDQHELERLKVEAESKARLRYAEIDRDYKIKDLERKENAGKASGGQAVYSTNEIEAAQLDVERAKAQIDVVNEEMKVSAIRVKQQESKLKDMSLRSRVNGVVETIHVREGELSSLDTDKPAIVVVQNDPLHVIVTGLKTGQVSKLEMGEAMDVRYFDEQEWQKATLIFKTPYADASADQQTVWLELPNPKGRDAGLPIQVKLPEKLLINPAVAGGGDQR